jgi:hypothetical protein
MSAAPHRLRQLVLTAALLLILPACFRGERTEVLFPPGGMALDSTGSQPRRYLPVALTVAARTGGTSEADTTIINPYRMAVDTDRVYLLEADQRVLCFDTSGVLLWSQGKEGGGPGEYRNVRDMKVAPDHRLWLLDPFSSRITMLDRAGTVQGMLPLQAIPHSEVLATLPDGSFALFHNYYGDKLSFYRPPGQAVRNDSIPWPGFYQLDPLARGFLTAGDPRSGRWAIGFIWGNGWFAFDSAGRPHGGRRYFVEPTRFAPVIKEYLPDGSIGTHLVRTPAASLDLALRDDTLFVLFDGQDPDRRQKLDMYDWDSGNYLGTIRLPQKADNVGVVGSVLAVYSSQPLPSLTFYRRTMLTDTAARPDPAP